MTATPLKLLALDADDLSVLSAHLQDALMTGADLAFMAKERRFVLVCDRFDWSAAGDGACQRRRTGVRFERVRSVQAKGLSREGSAALELLALRFEEGQAPSGTIEMVFAGGAGLRLQVECIEAAMDDLGPQWDAGATPAHG